MHTYLPDGEGKKKKLTDLARRNRRAPTDAEKKMWRLLRGRRFVGWKFRRQHQLRAYIVDFVCLEERLIVELDGGHHSHPEAGADDACRTEDLAALGFRVLRFWNREVLRDIDQGGTVIHYALRGGELK
ncbi:MAG: endonuclease domain-containing protein [Planctomycetaceae bacterium]|nr:endonuclease domain-containing protein [Planctomycetaceae bacterium]